MYLVLYAHLRASVVNLRKRIPANKQTPIKRKLTILISVPGFCISVTNPDKKSNYNFLMKFYERDPEMLFSQRTTFFEIPDTQVEQQ